MKRFAALAVAPCGVVTAVARQTTGERRAAFRGVSVALAPPTDAQIGDGVLVRRPGRRRNADVLFRHGGRRFDGVVFVALRQLFVGSGAKEMEAVEDDFDVRRRHPVLKDGRVVELSGARAPFERREGDTRTVRRVC